MVTVECLVLGWTCQLCTTVISVWKVSQCDSDTVYSFFSVWPSFLTHGSTRVNPRTQKFSDCSFLSNNFVMICAGGLAVVPACRLANNCSHFSSCLCICIFICWLFIVLIILIYFSIQGKSECHNCCLLLVLWRVFFLPIGREGRPFAFSWKGKHKHEMLTFFIFVILHWNGRWNWCSIFLDKYSYEVFLVWWYCTIPNISGTICQFEHKPLSKFLIWRWYKKKISAHLVIDMK